MILYIYCGVKPYLKFLFLIVFVFSCGGIRKSQDGVYPVVFEPLNTTLNAGICESHIKIPGDLEQSVTLLTVQITLIQKSDTDVQVSYSDTDVESLLGSLFLAQASLLEGDLTIDGPARGMTGGFDVTFILFGTASNGYVRTWVGSLECNE